MVSNTGKDRKELRTGSMCASGSVSSRGPSHTTRADERAMFRRSGRPAGGSASDLSLPGSRPSSSSSEIARKLLSDDTGFAQACSIHEGKVSNLFDDAIQDLLCRDAARQHAALLQLARARGRPFRLAVRRLVLAGATPVVRCLALKTYLVMGGVPAEVALAAWIDGTGPDLLSEHALLFEVLVQQSAIEVPRLLEMVENPIFRSHLARAKFRHERTRLDDIAADLGDLTGRPMMKAA